MPLAPFVGTAYIIWLQITLSVLVHTAHKFILQLNQRHRIRRLYCIHTHTGYPETTNAQQRTQQQQAVIGSYCKHLSGNNLPQISLICGKLFPDRFYILFPPVDFDDICCFCGVGCQGVTSVIPSKPKFQSP